MITIKNISVTFPGFSLKDIDFTIDEGEFFILLGPTGAGKTVLLEAIAGLVPVRSGRITITGHDVTDLPPEKREVGIVYQDYALFPHLSVLENIRYGLRFHNIDKQESEFRLSRLLEQLGLSNLVHRSIEHLSGGEKQRVALARSLVVAPSILLLDEPLSALDSNFREGLRRELKRLQQETKITFFMVTHDLVDVMSLADRVAIINNGRIEQVGTVPDLFQRPNTAFVAEFVGMKNVSPATFNADKAFLGDIVLDLKEAPEQGKKHIAIRPEDITLSKESLSGPNVFKGRVSGISINGFACEVSVQVGNIQFKVLVAKSALFDLHLSEGMDVCLSIQPSSIHVF
ncbi:MAG: ABC transporter ATP-binding protein [Pseudomonadota bacterium]